MKIWVLHDSPGFLLMRNLITFECPESEEVLSLATTGYFVFIIAHLGQWNWIRRPEGNNCKTEEVAILAGA